MKVSKLFLLMSALVIAANAIADSPRMLTLFVAPSKLFFKDVPKLLGTVDPNVGSIAVALDMKALVKLIENFTEVEPENGFYREVRNLRNAEAKFLMRQVDGIVKVQSFPIEIGAPEQVTLEAKELLVSVDAEVTGTADVYKCFSPSTCVFEKTKEQRLLTDNGVAVKYSFRPLVSCRSNGVFINVEGSIEHPEYQRAIIHRYIARRLLNVSEVVSAKGEPVTSGEQFRGFTTKARYNLEVSRGNGTLRVETRLSNGKVRNSYEFQGCINMS